MSGRDEKTGSVKRVAEELAAAQTELDPEEKRILYANLDSLYEGAKSPASAATGEANLCSQSERGEDSAPAVESHATSPAPLRRRQWGPLDGGLAAPRRTVRWVQVPRDECVYTKCANPGACEKLGACSDWQKSERIEGAAVPANEDVDAWLARCPDNESASSANAKQGE